jgi:hypothetical protein
MLGMISPHIKPSSTFHSAQPEDLFLRLTRNVTPATERHPAPANIRRRLQATQD